MIHKIIKILKIFITIVCIILLSLSLFVYISHINRFTEMLSGLRLLYLRISAIFLFLAFIAMKKRSNNKSKWLPVLIASLSLIINITEVLPYYMPTPKPGYSTERIKLKVMLFNVFHPNKQFADALTLVHNEKPDIAVFLEATGQWPEKLISLTNEYPYHESIPLMQFEIYSKHPMKLEDIILYGKYRGFALLKVKMNESTEVILAASHAYPARYYGIKGFELRNNQVKEGIPEIASETNLPLIILGDFNMDMWSKHFKKMIKISGLHNARKGFGVLPSLWISSDPPLHSIFGIPADHCLVSKNIFVNNAYSGHHTGSDHLPMFFVLEIPCMNNIF